TALSPSTLKDARQEHAGGGARARRAVMIPENPFTALIRRVRAGDQEAAAELVRTYEPAVRRAVRVRLKDDRLRRVLDSLDICQSVLGSFFLRATLGEFELTSADDLLRLLATMVRNKVANQAAHEQAASTDAGKEPVLGLLTLV